MPSKRRGENSQKRYAIRKRLREKSKKEKLAQKKNKLEGRRKVSKRVQQEGRDGNQEGKIAEGEVTQALTLLAADESSLVARFIYTRTENQAKDSIGIDFLVVLRPLPVALINGRAGEVIYTLPLQTKRRSGHEWWRTSHPKDPKRRSWKRANLLRHYRRYPDILAIGVDGQSPAKIAKRIDNLIRRILCGHKIPLPKEAVYPQFYAQIKPAS